MAYLPSDGDLEEAAEGGRWENAEVKEEDGEFGGVLDESVEYWGDPKELLDVSWG